MSTVQTAPAQENPSTGNTLKNMQLVFTACRRKKKLFFVDFLLLLDGHTFSILLLDRTHFFSLLRLLFVSPFSLLTIGLLLHTTRAMWL